MLLIYIFLILLIINAVSYHRDGIYEGYVGIEQSNCIKGIFIIFVFDRHICPYMKKAGYDFSFYGDSIFRFIDSILGQLIVVMFLFYSGYGVMESYKKKGKSYIESIPQKRILTTLLNFDVAVLIFLLLNIALDMSISFTKYGILGNVRAIFFAMTFVLLSMKLKLNSPILEWLGKNLFPLYIYHGIGMILFANIYDGVIIRDYPYLYVVMCFILTVIFAWWYRFIQIKLS